MLSLTGQFAEPTEFCYGVRYIHISDWIYKKLPPNAGTIIIITKHVPMQNKGLALGSYDYS